jgi:hypothetical protein
VANPVVTTRADVTDFEHVDPAESGFERLEGDPNLRMHTPYATEGLRVGVALIDPCAFDYTFHETPSFTSSTGKRR